MGDVVLTQDDVVTKRDFPDGCVPSTWSIDLHYPKKQYAQKYADNPFISVAVHDRRIDRSYGYPVPYRCFYSRNIDNLFMAGRCISVTHEALGTTRVMKTCGMMGEVVGKAAGICIKHGCYPREVYTAYLDEFIKLLHLPGKAFRPTVNDEFTIPKDSLPLAGSHGPPTGISADKLGGLVIDDRQAKKTGKWTEGQGLKGYVGYGYLYAGGGNSKIIFEFEAPTDGPHEIRIVYGSHENRGNRVPVSVKTTTEEKTLRVNMKKPAPLKNGLYPLGKFALRKGEKVTVTLSTQDAGGNAHADAVQVVPEK